MLFSPNFEIAIFMENLLKSLKKVIFIQFLSFKFASLLKTFEMLTDFK